MDFPAIILAGGLGTRLRGVINDLPKPMAPVNGKPFLHYLFQYLVRQKVSRAVLSVGYKHEVIKEFFGNHYSGIDVAYSIETEPLGTGGGIKKAFEHVKDGAFVLNGDSFFDVDLSVLQQDFEKRSSDLNMALRPMKNFDRYGTVELDADARIIAFKENQPLKEGLINGGAYFFKKKLFAHIESGEKFSFEKDVMECYVADMKFTGSIFNGYFIDIGIPEDYSRAQEDFKTLFP